MAESTLEAAIDKVNASEYINYLYESIYTSIAKAETYVYETTRSNKQPQKLWSSNLNDLKVKATIARDKYIQNPDVNSKMASKFYKREFRRIQRRNVPSHTKRPDDLYIYGKFFH